MSIVNALWADERGFVLSAEAVALGTLGVVGATVGLGAMAKSANSELEEIAFAIRSLDQSYTLQPQQSGTARTAGSSYQQTPVQQAHAELRKQIDQDRRKEKARREPAEKDAGSDETLPSPKKKRGSREQSIPDPSA